MNEPVITVLITCYNYGRFIGAAIDSVLAQDFPQERLEVLVVDDGSTDDTAERVKKYGTHIDYVQKPNGGQASALNFGIARARGEIVALLDADDLFLPGKLTRLVAAFEQDSRLGLAYHRLQEWNEETGERRDWEFVPISGDIREAYGQFALYVPQPTSAIAFRRSLAAPLLPIPEQIRMLADCYLVALMPFLAPVLAIPESLGVYRIHGKNNYSSFQPGLPLEVRKRNLELWRIEIAAMREWVKSRAYSPREPLVRSFEERWSTFLEGHEFSVRPPGRVRFFRHLLRSFRYRTRLMKPALVFINYLDAFGALIFGYEGFSYWQEKREGLLHGGRRLVRGDAAR